MSNKSINILSLVESYNTLDKDLYEKYLNFYEITIKNKEVKDLEEFIKNIIEVKKKINLLSNYFVGYKIPQIGKEFDLLRFGKEYIINIEIKNKSTEEKILTQLSRNKYYLSFLKKDLHCFSYIVNKNQIYYLDNNNLEKVNFTFLVDKIIKQQLINIENIDTLFDPTNYLVSPFNTTEKFIKNQYFLTHQQEEIKTKIIKLIEDTKKANFIAIKGSAGTGKTLLTYDIAKSIIISKKVLIIHCGILNNGQEKLISKYNWDIIKVKDYKNYDLSKYNLIIIDEVQRIYPFQLNKIINSVQKNKSNCIFSYDNAQTLRNWEKQNDIDGKINALSNLKIYSLTEKIRTNKEIANFIKMFIDTTRNNLRVYNKNINVSFYSNIEASKSFQHQLQKEGWDIISFTPSRNQPYYEKFYININTNSHKVIGQEFDKVVVVIDDKFYYNNGKLQYRGSAYYHPVMMLFQNLTRARKKLHLIIVKNKEILERCLNILRG